MDVADEKPEGAIFIIPVRLDDVAVPQRLQKWQRADLFDKNGCQKIVLALNHRATTRGIVVTSGKTASAKLIDQASSGTPEQEAPCGAGRGTVTFQRRVKTVIKLDCTLDEFQLVNLTVQELLRKLSNDATLTINCVRAGSVILEIDCSEIGFKKIKSLFETQQLAKLFDFFKVESVSAEPAPASIISIELAQTSGGGMKCADFLEQLTDYLDGTIPQSARERLEEHLQWCLCPVRPPRKAVERRFRRNTGKRK